MLDDELNPKISDFGWSIKHSKNQPRNTFCGTYEYMAPEIYETADYDEKVDIWSIGILLYEIFYGKSPFVEKTAFRIFKNIFSKKPIFDQSLDPRAKDIISKTLQIDPKKRPSASELLKHPFFNEQIQSSNRSTIEKIYG